MNDKNWLPDKHRRIAEGDMKFLSWSRSSILESVVRLIGQGLIQMAIIVLTASPGFGRRQ